MLDFSFAEIVIVGTVALVVIGPERLPKVARTAGHLFGRLQRYVATVKADINREMEASDLAKVKQEVQDAARSFEHSIQEHSNSVEQEAARIGHDAQQAVQAPPASGAAPDATPDAAPVATVAGPLPEVQTLDFGVEPSRLRARA